MIAMWAGEYWVNHGTWGSSWASEVDPSSAPGSLSLVNVECSRSGCGHCSRIPAFLHSACWEDIVVTPCKHQIVSQCTMILVLFYFFHGMFWSLLWVRCYYVPREQSFIYSAGSIKAFSTQPDNRRHPPLLQWTELTRVTDNGVQSRH